MKYIAEMKVFPHTYQSNGTTAYDTVFSSDLVNFKNLIY